MASYVTPKKNAAFVFYAGLVSQANTKVFQSNPTLAAGDAKVSIDGAALNNLTTLPDVDPNSSKLVKVSLSADEMNGDNIQVILSDAAGDEWCDLIVNIQTTARQVDDLAFPLTTGRGTLVDASGKVSPSDASITNASLAADTGLKPLRSSTAVSGGASTIELDAGASAIDQFYTNTLILITGGTGVGQARSIASYVGATKVATLNRAWTTNPDGTSTFSILAFDGEDFPTAQEITDSVWNALQADYINAGSMGLGVGDAAELAGDTVLPDSVAADGTRPTGKQALLMLVRFLMEASISGTTYTVNKEDGVTPCMTLTTNDPTSPSAITRTT